MTARPAREIARCALFPASDEASHVTGLAEPATC